MTNTDCNLRESGTLATDMTELEYNIIIFLKNTVYSDITLQNVKPIDLINQSLPCQCSPTQDSIDCS